MSRKRAAPKKRDSELAHMSRLLMGRWAGDRGKGCQEGIWLREEVWDFHLVMICRRVYKHGCGAENKAQVGYTDFRENMVDKDVMRTVWQTAYWKAVGSQSRCREGQKGWSRNKQKAPRQAVGKGDALGERREEPGHTVRLGRNVKDMLGCPF